jgi:hypothetical protein
VPGSDKGVLDTLPAFVRVVEHLPGHRQEVRGVTAVQLNQGGLVTPGHAPNELLVGRHQAGGSRSTKVGGLEGGFGVVGNIKKVFGKSFE